MSAPAVGTTDAEGIFHVGYTDVETRHADHLEKISESARLQFAADRTRLTDLEKRTVLGRNRRAAQLLISSASTWTDVCTVTATSHGRLCQVDWKALLENPSSGATRVLSMRVVLDGVAMAPTQLDYTIPNGAPFKVAAAFDHDSTPAAGSHTWKLQAFCTGANATAVSFATMTIEEF